MINYKTFAVSVILLTSAVATAQDSLKTRLSLSGCADAYYRYNFHNAKDSARANNLTSFTNSQNSFELGMASFKAGYTHGKTEAVLDLGFGTRAAEFSYNDAGTAAAVKQAYIAYALSDKIKFTIGKWSTHFGYELLDAYLNRNYSMSYLFSYGPFFHTGLKTDIIASKNLSFMAGLANPTDMTTASYSRKFFLGQVRLISTDGRLNCYLNYAGGKDNNDVLSNQLDAVITGIVTEKFSIAYNGSIKTVKTPGNPHTSWWGAALYFNAYPTPGFGLSLRSEYFGDANGASGIGTDLYELTLSGNIHADILTFIPEFRFDGSKDPVFYKNTDESVATAKTSVSLILAVVINF